MTVGELGEFELIARIERWAQASLPRPPGGSRVVIGIGDDAAVLRPPEGHDLVVTTDAFVEGVHFRFDQESPATAGRRAMVANLSDLAAMGARPLAFTLALAVPALAPLRKVSSLVRGSLAEAGEAACPLVGGNVTRASEISLAITAHGTVRRSAVLRRSAGRAGDRLWVTGSLGRSALERARGRVRTVPSARLGAGQALARLGPAAGACIDVSDGLLADAAHLARASGVRAIVRAAAVPVPRGFQAACRSSGLDPAALALEGGEDFELLFSTRPGAPEGGAPPPPSRRAGDGNRGVGAGCRHRARGGVPESGPPWRVAALLTAGRGNPRGRVDGRQEALAVGRYH